MTDEERLRAELREAIRERNEATAIAIGYVKAIGAMRCRTPILRWRRGGCGFCEVCSCRKLVKDIAAGLVFGGLEPRE